MKINRLQTILVVVILIATFSLPCRSQGAALLLNGSFEGPALAANSYVAGGGTSWTSSGTAYVISNDYGSYGNTPYGSQYLDLNTAGDSDAQTITGFVAGQSYVLGAYFADLPGAANPQLTLSVAGAATGSSVTTGTVGGFYGTGTIAFQSATLVFTAVASGSATITLTNSSGASGNAYYPAIAVDNLTLSGVPEPTTCAAGIFGAVGLGIVALRRRLRHGGLLHQ